MQCVRHRISECVSESECCRAAAPAAIKFRKPEIECGNQGEYGAARPWWIDLSESDGKANARSATSLSFPSALLLKAFRVREPPVSPYSRLNGSGDYRSRIADFLRSPVRAGRRPMVAFFPPCAKPKNSHAEG